MAKYNKYALYELSVQSPKQHADWYVSVYKGIRGKYARHLREDFCGTFAVSCEWVKRNKQNTAVSLDLDDEPLSYGKRVHRSRLTAAQKKRLDVRQQNVITVTQPKADLIIAGNFSFFIFKDRKILLDYLRCCLKSLGRDGVLVLELAGGPGMVTPVQEKKVVRTPRGNKFTYIWHQKSFDPIQRNAKYAIHFKLADGTSIRNSFTYDWRLWTIPEVREAMLEVGFKDTEVHWETEHRGKGTGEFAKAESGDNAFSWIGYVIGLKD